MGISITGVAIGVILAVSVGLLGRLTGMDRDRAAYPVILIIIAFYYVLFAAISESQPSFIKELAIATIFSVFALTGFLYSLWFVVLGLAAHGLFDVFHPHFLAGTGAPSWWPGFCLGIDLVLAAILGWLLHSGQIETNPT
ncbi:MAG: hypothetical protein AAFR75_00110 [Pseudomonadota bacterium]